MRPALIVLLLGLAGLAVAPFPAGPASASCVGPQVELSDLPQVHGRPVLERGTEVTVTGTFFRDGCDDGGPGRSGMGCSADDTESEETPMRDVELRLGPTLVGTADATGERSAVSWTFTVPDDLDPGLVTLRAGDGGYGRVRIR